MRSHTDVVILLITAVEKRIASNKQLLERTQNTPQQVQMAKGQLAAGQAILGDLTDLYGALTEGVVKSTPEMLCLGLVLEWRRKAQQWLSATFSAHAKSDEPFANRFFGNHALIYAYVADELAYALETRDRYEPLEPAQRPFSPLAC